MARPSLERNSCLIIGHKNKIVPREGNAPPSPLRFLLSSTFELCFLLRHFIVGRHYPFSQPRYRAPREPPGATRYVRDSYASFNQVVRKNIMHSLPLSHFPCSPVTCAGCLTRGVPEDPACAYVYTRGSDVSFQWDAYFLTRIDQVRILNHFPVGFEDFWIIHGIAEILPGNL